MLAWHGGLLLGCSILSALHSALPGLRPAPLAPVHGGHGQDQQTGALRDGGIAAYSALLTTGCGHGMEARRRCRVDQRSPPAPPAPSLMHTAQHAAASSWR